MPFLMHGKTVGLEIDVQAYTPEDKIKALL
jgi:hypothetical protein